MRRGQLRTGWLAAAGLVIAVAMPAPGLAHTVVAHPVLARSGPFHPAQERRAAPPARQQAPRSAQGMRAGQARPRVQGHAGDWLRRYKDLPPAEQERALQNDPGFRRLPPAQQQLLRQRLQHFSSLPPQQQLRVLNRMETWEHLTPEQKQQARQIYGQMRQLPPVRQRMVTTAVRDLRAMPPDQRERIIDSPRFRNMFSDQEREMMRGATRLPLAPAEDGEKP
ncbi:MAG TPA: DUF3106 domain-containing protein [Candidatus Sulfotelmatobacter sp.]|nr:DUF3106 domain-containing protein [Candidatus Sulfotelmatobacter sp.]